MEKKNILDERKNCWKIANASRAAFLIDAAAYFSAFVKTVQRARSSILVLGWDIDSRVPLLRRGGAIASHSRLGDFLNQIVSQEKGLEAHILIWDFSMIYALERESLPIIKLGLSTHRRLHFKLDGRHPVGASHHQKVVVVDDCVAFVGGIDLTGFRWDTQAHKVGDSLRIDESGQRYGPFHDVQMAVGGDAARALGDLVRERWRRATGKVLSPPRCETDVWPPDLAADVLDVPVAISRTEPAYKNHAEVREIEALYCDAIAAAQRWIYIENQYLTSKVVVDALARRLAEEDGPEILIVLPRESSGWLEVTIMDALRAHAVRDLRAADRFDRLGICYPHLDGLGEDCIHVHSKVLVVDDAFVRVGSSNISNRSMGLDTECDLSIEADGRKGVKEAIGLFRNRLLGEHLGVSSERVAREISASGSILRTVAVLKSSGRWLEPLAPHVPEVLASLVQNSILVDPERPADPDRLIGPHVPREARRIGKLRLVGSIVLLLALLALAAVWQWTPLKSWLDLELLTRLAASVREHPLALLFVLGAYVLGGLVSFPATILIVATAITFGPLSGFFYALAGCVASAVCTYAVGHALGREALRRFAGKRINRISRQLANRGLLTVIIIRLAPVAPFTVVNLVAGASHIRFWDFALGTIFGMAPGLFAITLFGDQLEQAIRDPGPKSLAILAGFVALIIGVNVWFRKWLSKRKSPSGAATEAAD